MIVKAIRNVLGNVIIFFDWITRPRKIQRTEEVQKQVEQALQQLALYEFRACPFCVKTRRTLHRLNLPLELRNAKVEPHRQTLLEQGGKIQVPCLRIDEQDESGANVTRWMYESSDIIAYLNGRFSG